MALVAVAIVLAPLPFHLITFFTQEVNIPLVKRLKDSESISYSTDVRKLLKSVSLEMFQAHPVTGVGADNFGMQFNDYRIRYADKNPTDVNLMTAETETAERSHNEYLQILAELGIVGGLIFLWFLAGIGLMAVSALIQLRRISLIPLAGLLGVGFFLASSFISSFSFRLIQNGFVFFFVLAIAAKFLFRAKSEGNTDSKINLSPTHLKLGYALGITASLLLTVHCVVRVTSVYYSNKAQHMPEVEQALPYYQIAFRLDDENSTARYAYGMKLLATGKYSEAAEQLEISIAGQRASSTDFSYLATAQTMAGDNGGAEKTLARAMRLYPFSTFVRIRYATLLQANGKLKESAEQFQTARQINKSETNTWWSIMNEGPREASLRAAQSEDFLPVYKLSPEQAVHAVATDRELKYPGENFKISFGN
jgi:tetratricopeptide (TPR) repeat protein